MSEIILDNIPTIITVLVSMIPTVWLLVQKIIDKKQQREDKKLELQEKKADQEHNEKITTMGTNFSLISQKVKECYCNNQSQIQMEEEVRKLIDLHKMNGLNQTFYVRYANEMWEYMKDAERINRNV